ncbi:EmrB/QacA subfamily drug resistance transporter [Tamilnaduibacter salinus]|uniref:EmrB/QacA subfamily drug resistance transporter n=1 Tax=Tamilnaduibacter salinus TaxID=1484056 RepID=A0A2A2I1B0_9GAMM|nr:DHA2 family efflux MFS transporter permease subunit [Tamilnaduibacter salinus]PAV25519.1 MFS transporter [Tamilnaduibacter salinus]PVY77346.1 EmrB/QacA subfamily drug resistance transporter [Tamilnaduibacter salinus]
MTDFTLDALRERHGDQWRWYAVATVMLGTMATVLSATIVNVALPDIMADFAIHQGIAHWFATGFIAAMTTSMLATGWFLDRFGLRRTLGAAMALFTLISVAGGLAPSPGWLILTRVGQGVMAGLMQPMAMYLVFRVFPRDQRGRAMGIYGMGVILAPALGPVLGGFLVDQLDWRFVMFAPAPVTLLGLFMVRRFIPHPVNPLRHVPFDGAGLLWLSLTIALSLDALNRLQHGSQQVPVIVAEIVLTLLSLALFVRRERRATHPLMHLPLMAQPAFRAACLGALALGLALFGSTYLIPLFVQSPPLSYSATDAGLLMLPAGVVLGIVFPVAGRLADRRPARGLIVAGILIFAVSTSLFALSDIALGFGWLALWAVIGRIGLGFMLPALSTGALNPLATQELGHGSGIINFMRMLGGAYGVNAAALTLAFGDQRNGMPTVEAFHAVWWLMTGCILLALVPIHRLRQ